ncbi:MAG: hypothetical protein HQ534_10970 [Armatimonadetes bacterium]|nr:hypothetical protein [Armatimonadota bacterium]
MFSKFKKTPNILAGHSLQDFVNYNLYYFFATFLLVGIQKLVIFPFIANKLGAEQFGSFVLFMTIINIIIVAIPGCINLVIIRVHSQYEKYQKFGLIKSGLLLNFILSIFTGILFFFIFPFFAKLFKIDPIYKIFLFPLAVYLVVYNIREGFLILKRIDLKFKEIAIYNIIFAILFILIIPLYSVFREKGISLGYVLIVTIATLIILPKTINILKGKISSNFLKQFYKFSPSFALASILELLLIASSRYIISYYKDPTQVAYFFAATSVVQVLAFPFAQIRTILLPFISQKKSLKEFKLKEIKAILFTSLGIGILMFVVGMIIGKFIITSLYGLDYYAHSRVVLFIILFGYIFNVFKIYLKNFIIVFFKRSVLIFNVTIMLLINIFINILFVPKYGINASAAGLSISLIISAIMWYVVFVRKLSEIRE